MVTVGFYLERVFCLAILLGEKKMKKRLRKHSYLKGKWALEVAFL